jgi:3-hydroxybutyryl-CoA dehydrogenase
MRRKPRIAAVGAGRMGRGLAHVFAYAGHRVSLIDLKPRENSLRAEALGEIEANLRRLAGLGMLDGGLVDGIVRRIDFADAGGADDALAAADVIFEGVPETAEAKRPALARIGAAARADAILASTTSTMLVDELAAHTGRPERFLNAHWLNPAYLIPLVEVSPGAATEPAVLEAMTGLLRAAGKQPVVCAARPGFIVPRIQALAMNEAARMVEEGVASPAEIDRAIRTGFGVRYAVMGLIEFIDWGGGDILYHASRYLTRALDSDRYAAPAIVERNMREGRVGLRSGRGFYDFAGIDADAHQRETLRKFVDLLRHLDLLPPPGAPDPDEPGR